MLWRKTFDGMIPCDQEAQEWFTKTKDRQMVEMRCHRHRNPGQHRKYFALLNKVVENTDFVSTSELLYCIKVKLNYGEWKQFPGMDRPFFIEKSINFASMKQHDFEKFYNESMNVIIRDWLPCNRADLEMELICA